MFELNKDPKALIKAPNKITPDMAGKTVIIVGGKVKAKESVDAGLLSSESSLNAPIDVYVLHR